MNQARFQQVWFADEKRNSSVTKMLVFSDKGLLEAEPDRLMFKGNKLALQISNIKDVSLARQKLNWISYLITNVAAIVYFALLIKLIPDFYSWSSLLTLLLVSNIFGLVVGYSTKWVRIEYSDDDNKNTLAFFADGSSFGWGGIFGGTIKMYKTLKSSLE
jgi:hypothetical protein